MMIKIVYTFLQPKIAKCAEKGKAIIIKKLIK